MDMLSVFITPWQKPTACHCATSFACLAQLRVMLVDDVIGERPDMLVLAAGREQLERAESHMTRRHAREHGCGFDVFADHRLVAADDGERPRGGNAEGVHGFGGEVFADR
jgi:hypothetical protein